MPCQAPHISITGIGWPADKRASHALPRFDLGAAWEAGMVTDQDALEVRAYAALQGWSGGAGTAYDWRDHVVAALRSGEPLSESFREVLAEAFDGDLFGFRLELVADGGQKKRAQDLYSGVRAREKWMEIGDWIRERTDAGLKRGDAIQEASQKFAASSEKCNAALIYHDRATRYVAAELARRTPLKGWVEGEEVDMNGSLLLTVFHRRDASGNPLDSLEVIALEME